MINKIKEALKKYPLILRYFVFILALPIILFSLSITTMDVLLRNGILIPDTELYKIFRIIVEVGVLKLIGVLALLAILHFIFKWLIGTNEREKNGGMNTDNKNATIIKAEGAANVTIVHGNYEGLNQDVLELIKNNEENGYELELFDYILKYRNRLISHIKSLTKNSALNLIIGLITTIIGVLVLYKIFMESSGLDLLGYFSRISIAIFIEISSFFFLRLYSSNLFEIKYFHNELSNIDAKMIALKVALIKNDDEILKFILTELMKTERNQSLKKGETTVELEKMRFDREESKILPDTLTKILEPLLKAVAKEDNKK